MTTEIINALNAKFTADKLKAFANLTNYLNNPAGIGEHPDIVAAVDTQISKIANAADKIAALKGFL